MGLRALLLLPVALLVACPDNTEYPDADDIGFQRRDASTPDAKPADAEAIDTGFEDADAGLEDAEPEDAEPGDAEESQDAIPIPVTVAYTATAEDLLLAELYLTDTSTSRVKVNPPLAGGPAGGEKQPEFAGVLSISWTSDGAGLLYHAQQDTFDLVEAYLARRTGARLATPIKVSHPRPDSDGEISLTPHPRYLLLHQSTPEHSGTLTYIVDTSSAAPFPMQLSQGLFSSGPDYSPGPGTWIVFQDIIRSMDDRDLWLVDYSTGPNFQRQRVNPGNNLGFGGTFDWAPDGSKLVYAADETSLRYFELFYHEVSGGMLGPRERVHPPYPSTADIQFRDEGARFSPDGTKIAFLVDANTDNLSELFVVDLTSSPLGPPLLVNEPQRSGGIGVDRTLWSPDSTRIVYRSDQDLSDTFELHVVFLGGTVEHERVHPPLAMGSHMFAEHWVRGGERLIYSTSEAGMTRLWSVDFRTRPLPAPDPLSGQLGANENVDVYELSPDQRRMIYRATDADTGRSSLYLVDLVTEPLSAPVRIAEGPPGSYWCWAPDNVRMAVVADQDTRDTGELYLIQDLANPRLVRVSGPVTRGGKVISCAFPPN